MLCGQLKTRGYRPVTGGTDNHLLLLDLRSKRMTGDTAEKALEEAGIMANRNVIPFDPESTNRTSGLRMGAAGITVRGMGEAEVGKIAGLIDRVLASSHDRTVKEEARKEVQALCRLFPLPGYSQSLLPALRRNAPLEPSTVTGWMQQPCDQNK